MSLNNLMAANRRTLLVGPPGIGKTARIEKIAADNNRRLIVMRASLSERVDFGGALVPDTKLGITRALPLELLHELQHTTERILLNLDDLGQAPIDVQAALMRLFEPDQLADGVLIWGTTNRPGDAAGVTRLCEPLRSRFHLAFGIAAPVFVDGKWQAPEEKPDGGVILGTWKDEVDSWCDWALDNGAPAEVIAYQRFSQGMFLYNWKPNSDPSVRMPDYRAWENVMHMWNAGIQDRQSMSASIGKPAAAEFLAFAKLAHELPSPDQVWMDPMGAPVPAAPASRYLVASMLANAVELKFASAMVKYMTRLDRVYGALLARDAHKRLGTALSGDKEWVKWFAANQDIFATGGN